MIFYEIFSIKKIGPRLFRQICQRKPWTLTNPSQPLSRRVAGEHARVLRDRRVPWVTGQVGRPYSGQREQALHDNLLIKAHQWEQRKTGNVRVSPISTLARRNTDKSEQRWATTTSRTIRMAGAAHISVVRVTRGSCLTNSWV